IPKIKRFQNPLRSPNGHASSSTTATAQALLRASTNSSQAHEVPREEQAPVLQQQEQAPILPQQEQAPIPPQQEQIPILPSNSSATSMR
ncbi:hypothetical protein HAX54_050550, partial [Datura stramonium]|nr:hypothetical protein [Datura stramonium]